MSNDGHGQGAKDIPLVQKIKNLFKRKNQDPEDFIRQYDESHNEKLEPLQKEMITGIMEISGTLAREIMVPRVDLITLDKETTLTNVIKLITTAGHSRIPVYEETIDHIIGNLYAKDLLPLITSKSKKFDINKFLHEPFFIPETMPLDELLLEFKKRHQHLAIVVDEYGGVAGLVTMEDILEEIVGEIQDEFDSDELPDFSKVDENVFELDSRMSLSDLNDKLNLNLPSDEFDTVGGFVYDQFGKIPKKNETIEVDQLTFKIKDIEGTKINRILMTIVE